MKQFTSRSPCLTLTHSKCRGELSSRALAQSCPKAADPKNMAPIKGIIILFMASPLFPVWRVSSITSTLVKIAQNLQACATT